MSGLIPVDPARPDPRAIEAAAGLLKAGKVLAFPTTGLYGLGADAFNPRAVERIFEIKGRERNNPILALIGDMAAVETLARDISPQARAVMERFWPGGLTLVLKARPGLPAGLTAGTGKIGIRRCAHPVATALIQAVGRPITGTSANPSGAPAAAKISDLPPLLQNRLDMILDAGPLTGGPGSTVIDLSGPRPLVLRAGRIPPADILEFL